MLTGRAKTDYQREYMRRRRSNAKRSNAAPVSVRPNLHIVRPKQHEVVRPAGVSDNQWAYIQMKAEANGS